MTIFRFIFIYVPGEGSKKLKYLIIANIVSGILTLMIVYGGNTELACYLSAIMFGASMSSLYPLILAFPKQSGLDL